MAITSLFDKIFKDKKGTVVLFQMPNPPLIGWFLFKVLSYLPVPDRYTNGFEFISTGFILIWAYLEIVHGASIARRILGVIVLVAVIIPKFM